MFAAKNIKTSNIRNQGNVMYTVDKYSFHYYEEMPPRSEKTETYMLNL